MDDADIAREITSILAPLDPPGATAKILRYVVSRMAASGGAIIVPREQGVFIVAVCDLAGDRGGEIPALWRRSEIWLQKGQPIQQPSHVVWPIRTRGDAPQLLGGIFLDAPRRFDARTIEIWAHSLGEALLAANGGRVKVPPPPGRDRGGLVELLEQNEWNIARVARLCGVTRRTVYLRMQRYGIPREHVAKSVYHSKHKGR